MTNTILDTKLEKVGIHDVATKQKTPNPISII